MIVAAVPVKDLINAKQRLVPALGAAERAALAVAMLQDVLAALAAAQLDRVWVVTREPAVVALARARGAEPLAEDANRGHTAAVARAQAEATRLGARVFLTVPGDVPCVTADEVRRLVAGRRPPASGRRASGVVTVRYEVIGVEGIGEVRPGDDVAALVIAAAARQSTPLRPGDLAVISQKIVSKAEGRLLRLADVTPSAVAAAMAAGLGRDPRLVEVILRESRRVVRMDRGVLVTETHHGWVCANAGVDQSNVDADTVALLPEDPDRAARALRERFSTAAGGAGAA